MAGEAEQKGSEEKQVLRRKMKEVRRAVSDRTVRNRQICSCLLQIPQVQEADCIYVYASYGTEADTFDFIRLCLAMGKRAALPRVSGREMDFYWIESLDDLKPGAYGIPEPGEHCQKAEDSRRACMILPGLAFDRGGHRLGYGGGYYDRYLERHPFPVENRIALAYECQITETVPWEPEDIPVGMIVTEAGAVKTDAAIRKI